MKLAEALILRADAQKRIQQLRDRLLSNAKVQEGEAPAQDPYALLRELDATQQELAHLIKSINRTNATTAFDDKRTIADALADRDSLLSRRTTLGDLIKTAMSKNDRYSRTEIRLVLTVDVDALQKQADEMAKEFRMLDMKIQAMNWSTDLIPF